MLKAYLENSRKILRSYNNPLKRPENLERKDALEIEFYDGEAARHLSDFSDSLFKYDPDEDLPLSHQYFYSLLKNPSGKKILDIGCGYGFTTINLAKNGAELTSIDISPRMIELTRKNAAFNGVGKDIRTAVMSAQKLQFPDNSFDFVVGLGILHHLNLDLAGREIHRVLKPGGQAIFLEPRIPFKFLILIRSLFPNKCFESPGGSQLSDDEIGRFCGFFRENKIEYFLFLRKLARFPVIRNYSKKLDALDRKLILNHPRLKAFYWSFVVQAIK